MSHDKIGTRLGLILTRFNSGESFTVSELAEEFSVSEKTIQRDLNQRLSYFPIQKKAGRYCLEKYYLGKLNFNDIKNFATFSGLKALYPSLDNSFIVDVLNSKINPSMHIKGHQYEDLSHKLDDFTMVASAIVTKKQLHFSYKEKQRVVNPYRLLNTNGVWYLAATENDVLKAFSFSKISELKHSKNAFRMKKKIVENIEDDNGTWFTQKPIEVTLEVDVSVAEYFLRRELLPHQKVLESTEEKLTLFTKVAYEEEILKVVRYWIPHITITAPAYLQKNLEAGLEKYLSK
ncbi:MAG: WYL domain-containing protein [Campylobacterota bacterium]|nr:WYL domain-containing protein [Campylobacterota bacterium]